MLVLIIFLYLSCITAVTEDILKLEQPFIWKPVEVNGRLKGFATSYCIYNNDHVSDFKNLRKKYSSCRPPRLERVKSILRIGPCLLRDELWEWGLFTHLTAPPRDYRNLFSRKDPTGLDNLFLDCRYLSESSTPKRPKNKKTKLYRRTRQSEQGALDIFVIPIFDQLFQWHDRLSEQKSPVRYDYIFHSEVTSFNLAIASVRRERKLELYKSEEMKKEQVHYEQNKLSYEVTTEYTKQASIQVTRTDDLTAEKQVDSKEDIKSVEPLIITVQRAKMTMKDSLFDKMKYFLNDIFKRIKAWLPF